MAAGAGVAEEEDAEGGVTVPVSVATAALVWPALSTLTIPGVSMAESEFVCAGSGAEARARAKKNIVKRRINGNKQLPEDTRVKCVPTGKQIKDAANPHFPC